VVTAGSLAAAARRAAFFLAVSALAAPPQRIVSCAPSITEMLYAMGLGDRIVAVTDYDHYPPEAAGKPKIGGYTSPNLEAIAARKPDLVIIESNPVRLADQLAALHLKTLEIHQDDLAALYRSIQMVGEAAGAPAQAARLTESIRQGLDQVRQRAAGQRRTRVMFVVGRAPNRLDGLIIAGRGSHIHELLEIAGGENVFADTRLAYPMVSLEEVLARNPGVIVDMSEERERQNEVAAVWARAPSLAAVKQHRVFSVNPDIYAIPGPRIVQGAQALYEMLHPEPR